jgi:flagellar basal body-associated protein FliL
MSRYNSISLLLLIIAIVLFIIAAVLAFGWFGTAIKPNDAIGLIALASAFFAGAHIGSHYAGTTPH